jgi:hypothetical protein
MVFDVRDCWIFALKLGLSNRTKRVGASYLSAVDGNRFIFRNVVFFRWTKSKKYNNLVDSRQLLEICFDSIYIKRFSFGKANRNFYESI